MFRENNEGIDFVELDRRMELEISKIKRLPAVPSKTSAPGNIGENKAVSATGVTRRRRGLFRRLSAWFRVVRRIRRIVERIDGKAEALEARIGDLTRISEQRQNELSIHVQAAMTHARELHDVMDNKLIGLKQEQHVALDSKLNELRQELHRALDGELNETNAKFNELKREVMFQQRRLTRMTAPGVAADSEPRAAVFDHRLDSFYAAFEDSFRGSRLDIKERLVPYLDRLLVAGAGQPDKPILDIGCGRGEWLELLNEKRLAAYGVDLNTLNVEYAKSLDLDARNVDLLEHLQLVEDGGLSAVTAFHVVEHLPFETLIDFLDEALRVLTPGGVLILETPNPETVRVGATTFYNDPTHRNPIPPAVLQFMVEHRGFELAETVRLHPFTQGLLQEASADAALLNRVLFGPQDYAIIARRG